MSCFSEEGCFAISWDAFRCLSPSLSALGSISIRLLQAAPKALSVTTRPLSDIANDEAPKIFNWWKCLNLFCTKKWENWNIFRNYLQWKQSIFHLKTHSAVSCCATTFISIGLNQLVVFWIIKKTAKTGVERILDSQFVIFVVLNRTQLFAWTQCFWIEKPSDTGKFPVYSCQIPFQVFQQRLVGSRENCSRDILSCENSINIWSIKRFSFLARYKFCGNMNKIQNENHSMLTIRFRLPGIAEYQYRDIYSVFTIV